MKDLARFVVIAVVVLALLIVGIVAFAWSGIYDIGADNKHTKPVHALLETLRERSIETRADEVQVPSDLADPARIRQGSGNYAAMCVGCHLAPGIDETELSRGLYPVPPNLAKKQIDPAEAFWVIKHGIKASGMPAWGKSMDDKYIWNMVAFLQVLPTLNVAEYEAIVDSSSGHSHGGGETGHHTHEHPMHEHTAAPDDDANEAHSHSHDMSSDHHGTATDAAPSETHMHHHADGTGEEHPAKPAHEHGDGHTH